MASTHYVVHVSVKKVVHTDKTREYNLDIPAKREVSTIANITFSTGTVNAIADSARDHLLLIEDQGDINV